MLVVMNTKGKVLSTLSMMMMGLEQLPRRRLCTVHFLFLSVGIEQLVFDFLFRCQFRNNDMCDPLDSLTERQNTTHKYYTITDVFIFFLFDALVTIVYI